MARDLDRGHSPNENRGYPFELSYYNVARAKKRIITAFRHAKMNFLRAYAINAEIVRSDVPGKIRGLAETSHLSEPQLQT